MPNVKDSSIALDGKITFELDDGSTKIVDLANLLSTSALDLKVDKTTVAAGTTLTTRATTDADDAGVFTTASAITVTVHSSAKAGFGFYLSGAGVATFAGASGVTVTDKRTTGATNPVAALVQVGANAYEVIGSKA